MKKNFKIVVIVATIISIVSTLFAGMRIEPIYAATENILAGAYWSHYAESWEEYDKDILNTNWTNRYTGFDANISITGWQQLWIVDYDNYGNITYAPDDAYICNDASWGDKPWQLYSYTTADVNEGEKYTLKIKATNSMFTQSGSPSAKSFTVRIWNGVEGDDDNDLLYKTYTVEANSCKLITENIDTSYYDYGKVKIQITYGSYAFSREATKDLSSGKISQSRYNSLISQKLLLAPYTNQEDNLTGNLSFDVELNRKVSENSTSIQITDAGTTNSTYFTSTNSILGYNSYSSLLSSLYFSEFKKTLAIKNSNPVDGIIIPGLGQTDQGKNTICKTMVPQGVCIAGNYLLISAYDKKSDVEVNDPNYKHSKKHNSVIYVIDKNTKKYITTIILKNNTSHVGALAWNGKTGNDGLIYIADSTKDAWKVWKMPYYIITNAVAQGKDAVYANVTDSFKVSLEPGFITYHGGYVYVGDFVDNKNASMRTYSETGWLINDTAIKLPVNTQGISFAQGKDGNTYMFASASLGRKNNSKIYVCKANMNGKRVASVSLIDRYSRYLTFPNMSEDICIDRNGNLYTAYESASNIYHKGLDKKGISQNPVDRVTISSVSSMLRAAGYLTDFSTTYSLKNRIATYADSLDAEEDVTYEDDVLLTGDCGENLGYVLYNDGTLCITGYGAMNDYTSEETPWSDYADYITSICIGADVSSIGAYAFNNLTNLMSVKFSEFLYDESDFTIGDYAFGNCSNLSQVNMPDIGFNISATAFPNINENLQISSNSGSVSDYCLANNISLHSCEYEYKETLAPTCGNYGYDVYECACGEETHDNFVEASDNHNYDLISHTESTCSQYGVNQYQCSECEAFYEEQLDLLEHTWDSGVVTKEATVDSTGTRTYTCSECGETKETEIEKLPKLPDESTTNKDVTNPIETTTNKNVAKPSETTKQIETTKNTKKPVKTKVKNKKRTSIKKLVAKKKAIKVTWKKKKGVKGYQLQYSTSKKFKKAKKITIKKAKTTSKTIKKLKAKKKYYVRIRTYIIVNGKKYYSKWSIAKNKKLNKDIS